MARGEKDAPSSVAARVNLLLQERQRQARLADLRRTTLRKADFLLKKSTIEYRDVYMLVRDFFKEFLEKRYEFTIKELHAELKKVYVSHQTRPIVENVLQRLEAAEYATVHYTREDLVHILADFKEAVHQLVRVHTSGKSFLERLKSFLFKEPDHHDIIAELPVIEGNDADKVRIYTLIEKCYLALDNHQLYRAKVAYEVLIKEYDKLPADERTQHYPIIHQTYLDLMNRAKMIGK
jgi:hypothetical protein